MPSLARKIGKYYWDKIELRAALEKGLITEDEYKLARSYIDDIPYNTSPSEWAKAHGMTINELLSFLEKVNKAVNKALNSMSDIFNLAFADKKTLKKMMRKLEEQNGKRRRRSRRNRARKISGIGLNDEEMFQETIDFVISLAKKASL
jgi:DNA-binding MarR family transcriptional regulator